MQKLFFVIILGILLLASTALAEIKVYDAGGQYLGILMNTRASLGNTAGPPYHGNHDASCTIFIPSIGKYTTIDTDQISSANYWPYEKKTLGDILHRS